MVFTDTVWTTVIIQGVWGPLPSLERISLVCTQWMPSNHTLKETSPLPRDYPETEEPVWCQEHIPFQCHLFIVVYYMYFVRILTRSQLVTHAINIFV
ncbi:hypothetical protein CEXT_273471 [Caerostris extrusa]|uniref:Uncharacterized protein n=1 Tax=Caerostris extrusa TaxID=172846 RepID=A0AAV4PWW1_CAEEX|nr:hypothetical protein CEXT_273471 [Caerostris extrusa]